MKHLFIAGKLSALLLSAVILAACSGSDTKEQDEAAARQAAILAKEQELREEERMEIQRLEQAAAAVGSVFYFEYDSSALTPAALRQLNAHIALLQKTDNNVRLEGHTDERGTRDYNLALGERRANSVRDYMVANGIATFRIETVSYGEEKPDMLGSAESSWSKNRRVELK